MTRIKLIGLSIFLVGVLSYNISTVSNISNVTLSDLLSMAMAFDGEAPDFNGSKVTKGYVKFEYKHKCPVTGIKIDWWKCKSGTKTQSCPVGAQSVHGPCGQL